MPADFARALVARWDHVEPRFVPLLREAGVEAVVPAKPDEGFARACAAAGIEVLDRSGIHFSNWNELPVVSKAPVVLTEGTLPGIASAGDMAGASSGPWVDANLHWAACLHALHPERPAMLGYLPAAAGRLTSFDALELALVEARVLGANYLLALEPAFRNALLAGDERARASWRRLGRTAAFLRANAELLGRAIVPTLTVLVEPGDATPEITNLLFRRCLSPAPANALDPPAPDRRRRVVVALDLKPPAGSVRRRILAHAEAGATVVVNGAWWRGAPGLKQLRRKDDRTWFTLGGGQVLAYDGDATDPGEFSYDAIDLVGQARRPVRLWAGGALLAVAFEREVALINYGRRSEGALVRVPGLYRRVRLLRPEAEPVEVRPARRGTATELEPPAIERLGIMLFD